MWRRAPLSGWLLLLAAVGAALCFWGLSLPAYTDASAASRIIGEACDSNGRVIDAWYGQLDDLRTLRYPLMNGAAGLFLAAVTVLILSSFLQINSLQDFRRALSPTRRWHFMALGIASLGWAWAGTLAALILGLRRDYYPWCADSVSIPMIGISVVFFLLAVACAVCGLLIMQWFGPLPASLGAWDRERPTISRTVTTVAALLGAALVVYALTSAASEYFLLVPACILAIYLIASARAALLNRSS